MSNGEMFAILLVAQLCSFCLLGWIIINSHLTTSGVIEDRISRSETRILKFICDRDADIDAEGEDDE